MLFRLIGSGATCALIGVLIQMIGSLAPPTITSAQNLLGERWYAIELDGNHIGYLNATARRDRQGRWLYFTELRFALAPGEPVTVSDGLVFDGIPPHRLHSATHANTRAGSTEQVSINRATNGYEAATRYAGAKTHRQAMPRLEYRLDDYLSFEAWLHTETPRIGSAKSVPTLDFSSMRIVAKQYRVIDHNVTGYLVESRAPFDHTSIQLDSDFAPVKLQMAGLFKVERTSKSTALRPRSALQSASYYIPADRRIPNHRNIERMVLGVHGVANADDLWPDAVLRNGMWTMTLDANPVLQDGAGAKEGWVDHSRTSHRIVRLAGEAVHDLPDGRSRVRALTRFVHQFMTYRPGHAYRPVPALLDSPVGDCTEFADLFTALANSLDIPARTIFGLAYRDADPPAFAYHAWNEVLVDGAWQAVDPTWNQLRVDATHIPLPSNRSTALQLLTGAVRPTFSVEQLVYFGAGA